MAEQNYANHARYNPPWHFFGFPILVVNMGFAIAALIREPTGAAVLAFLVAAALVVVTFVGRTMVLTLQNRIIRLEERLRLAEVLPEELQGAIPGLSTRSLIGLRFAGDTEVEGLVRRILAGDLQGTKAIKQAVTQWRPDTMRA